MRAHHEQKLEEKFVGIGGTIVWHVPQMAITILATDLAELAGPIGENTGKTGVRQAGIRSAAAAIEAATKCPAAVDRRICVGRKSARWPATVISWRWLYVNASLESPR